MRSGSLEVYVDGADEATRAQHLIKGGGAALTREKIIAAASKQFVCIIDDAKLVTALGKFPLPVEVIPMARSYVASRLAALGGRPVLREGVVLTMAITSWMCMGCDRRPCGDGAGDQSDRRCGDGGVVCGARCGCVDHGH